MSLVFSETAFDNFYLTVYNLFHTECLTHDIDRQGVWFTNNRLYFKCRGSMFPSKEHYLRKEKHWCQDCTEGWLFRAICRIYDSNENQIYFGGWNNGKPNGYGFEDNYFGYFKDGMRNGEGVSFINNMIYIGNFKDDIPCGRGTSFNVANKLQITQQWTNGEVENIDTCVSNLDLEFFKKYNMERVYRNIHKHNPYFGNPTLEMCWDTKLVRCEFPF